MIFSIVLPIPLPDTIPPRPIVAIVQTSEPCSRRAAEWPDQCPPGQGESQLPRLAAEDQRLEAKNG